MVSEYYRKLFSSVFLLAIILFTLTPCANADIPATPTGVSVIPGNGEISITWEMVEGAFEYAVYRSNTMDGTYGFVAQTQVNTCKNTGVSNGSTYYYVVTALNAEGQSAYSSPVSAAPTTSVLKAPTNIKAIPGNGAVSLTWDPVTSAVHYNVYRISPEGTFTLLTPSAPGPSYTDRSVTNGTQYYYVVQTMSTNPGAYSLPVIALPSETPPLAPEIDEGTIVIGSTWASFSWNASPGAATYLVYRGTDIGGLYDFQASLTDTAYEDSSLTNGTTYYYVVTATNENGDSAFSSEIITPVTALNQPHAPDLAVYPKDQAVYLEWNAAFGSVSYAIKRSEAPGGPYAVIDTATATHYTDSGLSNGTTYFYIIDAHNASPTTVSSNEASTMPTDLLPAPTNLATVPGNTQATLIWNPVTGATKYYVQIASSSGGPYSYAGQATKPSFTETGLTNGQTYYFRVRTIDYVTSDYSTEVSVTPLAALPLAPTGLKENIGNSEGTITWQPVVGATGYIVYRRTDTSPWSPIPAGTPTGSMYTDTGLINGQIYYYSVAAVNANGTGAWSFSVVEITPTYENTTAPVSVANITGNTQATLTWKPVIGVIKYYIEKALSSGGSYSYLSYATKPSFTATGLTNGQTYKFRIRSIDPVDSAFSSEISTTPSVSLPLAPTGLNETTGNTQGTLTWNPVDGATGYKVYRRTETSSWSSTPVGTLAGSMFTDTDLQNGVTYYYAVAAINANGSGAWSSSAIDITPVYDNAMAPTNVTVIPGNTQATVTWKPVVGATKYAIMASESSGGSSLSLLTYTPSLTVTGLTNNKTYYFRIRSDSPSYSAFSGEVNTSPAANLPMAPTGLAVLATGNTQGTLSWSPVDGATGYQVFRRTQTIAWSSSPVGTPIGTIFTDTGLTNGTTYDYTVAAVNATGASAWSSTIKSVTPDGNPPLMPSNVAAFSGDTQATLTWDPVDGAASYKVRHAISLGCGSFRTTTKVVFII